jgi:hypothetical protein
MFWNRKSVSEWTGDYTTPAEPSRSAARQFYSVGQAEDNQIALSLYSPSGISTTTTMNINACKQMIHMLQSAVEAAEANQQAEE